MEKERLYTPINGYWYDSENNSNLTFEQRNLVPKIPYEYPHRPSRKWNDNEKRYELDKKIPLDEYDFKDVTQEIFGGNPEYYPEDSGFRKGHPFYTYDIAMSDEDIELERTRNPEYSRYFKDNTTGKYYKLYGQRDQDLTQMNFGNNFKEVSIDEITKLLPKRDYIGGGEKETALKVLDNLPGIKDYIKTKSEEYGIDPNIVVNRLIQEGYLSKLAYDYNNDSVANQKNYDWSEIVTKPVSGFKYLGLDTFQTMVEDGKIKLKNNVPYNWYNVKNEDGTGRYYKTANFENLYGALEAKIAVLEYLQRLGQSKGLNGDDLKVFMNAAYNRGEYHPSLQDIPSLYKDYNHGNYYKNGGKINKLIIGGKINRFKIGEQYVKSLKKAVEAISNFTQPL